jgi:hypothetical protein
MRTFNSDADPIIMQQTGSDPPQPNHLERQGLLTELVADRNGHVLRRRRMPPWLNRRPLKNN